MTALIPHAGPILPPTMTDLTAVFWEGCASGKLLFQRCSACDAAIFDPAYRCWICLSTELRWEQSAGQGTIASWTVVWRPVDPSFAVPYVPAVVELDEGFHIVTNIVGCDHTSVRSGLRVFVVFHADQNGLVLPYFEPEPSRKEPT